MTTQGSNSKNDDHGISYLKRTSRLTKVKDPTFGRSFWQRPTALVFVVAFAAIGGYLLFRSFASSSFAAQEVESGSITAPAAAITDSSASGGKAISFGPASGTAATCPSASPVPIQTTDKPQNIVSTHPAGTVYLIKAGLHSGFSVSPQTGDTYCAETGAILDGGNTVRFAFDANGASNVTILGAGPQSLLEIRDYHSGTSDTDFQAPIHDNAAGEVNWLIRYVDVHDNFPTGVNVNSGTQLRDSKVHDNTTLAISAYKVSNVIIDHNEFYGNDSSMAVDCDFEAGAIKASVSDHLTYNNNYIHDNGCDGLWNDGGITIANPNASYNQYTNNIVVHNGGGGKGSGIHYEISGGPCTISGNYISNNNFDADPSTISAGQVFISNSYGCEIANNTIIGPKAVVMGDYDRSADCTPSQCPINNENVHDNNFYFNGTGLMVGGSCISTTCSLMTNGTNKWQNNHYHLPDVNASVFSWPNAMINKTQWQALGFDTNGTFDTNTTPPAQPAWSLDSNSSTSYGSDKVTVNVPQAGNYVVWSRIMAPNTTSQSYGLSIDGGAALNVGGSGVAPNTWTWINYQNGTSTSKITASLTSGSHTLTLTGTQPAVKVDRVLLLTDTSCTPTGTGDNCLTAPPPASNPPTVTMTATSSSVTQGQAVNLSAATADTSSTITSVSFFDGSTLIGTDTTSPYSVVWNTSTSTNTGSHSLTAKVTDAAGLTGTSSAIPVNVVAAPPTDTQPPTVSFNAPVNGAVVKGSAVTVSAVATDNTKVASVTFSVNGATIGSPVTTPVANNTYSTTWDTTGLQDGTYTIIAKALDTTVTGNPATTTESVTISNTVAPPPPTIPLAISLTAPVNYATVSGSSVVLTATPLNSAKIANISFSVDGKTIGNPVTTSPYSMTWDSTAVSNGSHIIMATAVDAAGNKFNDQNTVTVSNADTSPPTKPANLVAKASAYNQVDLTWTASSDNTGVAGYYIVRGGSTITKTTTDATVYTDTTVTANTNYTYYLYAYDAAGNVGPSSATVSVTTPIQPDTQAPIWPAGAGNLAASAVSSSQINLSWSTATDNVGVKAYQIYRNGATTPIATVTATSYGDTGLSANTVYTYTVKAVDASGNLSIATNLASAATQSISPPAQKVGTITGQVTSKSSTKTSTPLSGVAIHYVYANANHYTSTNSNGTYALVNIPAKTYSLSFSKRGYATQNLQVLLGSGQTITSSVTLIKR